MIADQWYIKATFVDDDPLLFDLGEDEASAREMFRETRRQFEQAKNNPSVHKYVDLGSFRFRAARILHLELVEPGADVAG